MSKKLLYLTAVLLLLVAAATDTAVAKPAPQPASNPNPADSATDVSITADLSWSAGKFATSHDVYFGTTSPGTFQDNRTATTFDPGTMDYDETYYWRIDEIGSGGTTTGSVWSFSTESEPDAPGQASSPSPGDDATGVSVYATLSWLAGSDATSHDVYFGTTSPGSSQGNQTGNIFDPPGIMDASTTYYWRIDEINALGTTTGVVWSFTTGGSGGETSTLITSIENSTQLADWSSNGTLSLSTDHVTNGSYCLKAVFGSVTPTLTYTPSSSFDVSGNRKIKFDIYVEGDTMTPTARFWDSTWVSYRSWYYLYNTGFQIVEYAIPGIETLVDSSDLIQINLAEESSLPTGSTIYIDNLRATDGPDNDTWLQNPWPGESLMEDANNILDNSDFELGLQSWGSWGLWDNGEYIFSAATGPGNAKSGTYSMSIICIDEGRGGIMTEEVLTLEATNYDLTFWVKGSDEGAECFYSFEGDDSANFSQGRYCNRFSVPMTWTEKNFTVSLTAESEATFYLFSTGTGTLYLDAVTLGRSDGQNPPDSNDALSMTPRVVTVSGQNTYVDSNPFFPIGIYGGVPSELGSTGFNLIGAVQGSDDLAFLDACEDNGFMTWISLTGVARGHMPEQADVVAHPLRNHPAILCWYNCDEPDHQGWNVPPPEIRFMTDELEAEDANHPTAVLNMAWTPSNMYQYSNDTTDIAMLDPYDWDVSVVVDDIDTLRDAAGSDKPIWTVLRFAWDTENEPTSGYLYGTTYGAVTHTSNGILWFAYDPDGFPTAWSTLVDITLELEALSDALTADTSELEVTVSDPDVDTILKEYDGDLYLIAVNIGAASNGVTLTVSGVTATQADVWFESRTETISSGTITDDFAENQRHVYVFTAP